MTHPIQAVVFDWAGTMVDFGCMAPVSALIDAFAGEGVAITAAEARIDMGRAKRDHVRALCAIPRIAAAWAAAKGATPSEADGDRIFAAVEPLMAAAAARSAELIPGAAALAARLTADGVKIGSCTGYTRAMMAAVLPRAAEQGYAPATVVCAGETAAGRPSPLMLWKVLVEIGAWPAWQCVKVDDAEVGIGEGRAAGAWTVGLAASGNGVGLSHAEYLALADGERRRRVDAAAASLRAAGADYVIDSVADMGPVLDAIAARISAGERPPA
ncbi:MAG TPA: phosphonoacetaldehyde hydrolase [Caulobacteraceae bacterium]|jgi:phosphonoacetaldehyde hydrolase|nr:phosphonoacetaldehyde hydrolase [Caulobacteraceae bacterium]